MEIFYSYDIGAGMARLSPEESAHCCRVLRRRTGDVIQVIDGEGTMYDCRLVDDNPRGAEAEILERHEGWGSHSYDLTMAVCPTKNTDRFEWFAEKATEIGVDELSFVGCKFSERKMLRTVRLEKIVVSAMKQSRKPWKPVVNPMVPFKEFLQIPRSGMKFIAHCYEEIERADLHSILSSSEYADSNDDITILIGPEGDFSIDEVRMAIDAGYRSISLGSARLRTETAALYAVMISQLARRIE